MKHINGIVISGKMKGRELGFPTANINFEADIEKGIYAGRAYYKEKEYRAAIYIGENSHLAEVYFFDFYGDLYGEEISVDICQKIRDPIKFNSEEELKAGIVADLTKIKNLKNLCSPGLLEKFHQLLKP